MTDLKVSVTPNHTQMWKWQWTRICASRKSQWKLVKNETLLQKGWFKFAHCVLSINR